MLSVHEMKFEVQKNNIYFSHFYGIGWVLGFFFIGLSLMLFWGASGGFSNYEAVPDWQMGLARVFGIVGISAGLYCIYQFPIYSFSLDSNLGSIEIRKKGLLRNEHSSYQLRDIRSFANIELKDDEDSPYYELAMELADGERIYITNSFHKLKEDFEHKAHTLNNFLRQ